MRYVSKRDRSFLRPDKRSMGSFKMNKALAYAMRDAIDVSAIDKNKSVSYQVKTDRSKG